MVIYNNSTKHLGCAYSCIKKSLKIISISIIVLLVISSFNPILIITKAETSQNEIKEDIKPDNNVDSNIQSKTNKINFESKISKNTNYKGFTSLQNDFSKNIAKLLKTLLEFFPGLNQFPFFMNLLDALTNDLTVNTIPDNCVVELKGYETNKSTNGQVVFYYLIEGKYTAIASKEGYLDQSINISLDADKTVNIELDNNHSNQYQMVDYNKHKTK